MSNITGKTVGVAFADATNRTLALSEFIDNDLFTNLEVRVALVCINQLTIPSQNSR